MLLAALGCEWAARRGWLPYWVSRKVLHVTAIGASAVAAATVDYALLLPLVAGAALLVGWLVARGHLMRDSSGRPAWGIVWFPLSYLWLMLYYGPPPHWPGLSPVVFGLAALAVCDPAATVGGRLLARRHYALTEDRKSLVGSVCCALSFVVLAAALGLVGPGRWWLLPLLGVWLAAGEALGSRGSDNLSVPLMAAWLAATLPGAAGDADYYWPALALGAPLFGYWALRRGSLDLGGAVATGVLGAVVVYGAGPEWLLPLLVFFGSSVLLGRWFPTRANGAGDDKHARPRDAVQVGANGLAYLLVIAYGRPLLPDWPLLLLVAAAAATADTWASELGQHFGRPTYDLLRGRRVPPGLSGGVSWPGTLAGLAGAGLIAALHPLLAGGPGGGSSAGVICAVALGGFGGMVLDSILGSCLQARYRDPDTGLLRDTPAHPGQDPARGYRWVTNDLVNLLATPLAVIIFHFVWTAL